MLFRQELIQQQDIGTTFLQSFRQLPRVVKGLNMPIQFLALTAEKRTHRLIIVEDPNVHQ
jgi:hypothetical protein